MMESENEIRVIVEFERWVCLCSYENREVPKAARFWWDRRRKAWVTTSAKVASGLIKFADKEAKSRILDKLNGRGAVQTEWVPAKRGRFGNHG